MGIILRCARCNKMIWLYYYKLPNSPAICLHCGKKESEQEKQQLSGDAYIVFYKFVEKYRGMSPVEELNKLINLLEVKYQIHITMTDFNEIEHVFKKKIEEEERIQSLEEFEKELLAEEEVIHKKIDSLINKDDDTKHYCTVCNNIIDKKKL